jgi:hypothetical protein
MTKKPTKPDSSPNLHYDLFLGDISNVIDEARKSVARSINCIMTAAYWLIGRRIVEFEQRGKARAQYGRALLAKLSDDLTRQYGRGFGKVNLSQMKKFYLLWAPERIFQTMSEELLSEESKQENRAIFQTASEKIQPPWTVMHTITRYFPLPWSAYVRLLSVKSEQARRFYETEALRAGWSVRQLDRQINSQFYERTALSKNKAAMLSKGQKALREDMLLKGFRTR